MSTEIVRAGQKYVATRSDEGLRKDAGKALMGVGAGGMVLGTLAWVLPFVNLPVLLVLAVIFGGYLYVK